MTAVQFRDWAAGQDSPYEYDGVEPVAMTGGTPGHSVIAVNITTALRTRLRGSGCQGLGSDAGIRTEGEKVRFPDATVTCSPFTAADAFTPDPIIVFEVVSPDSIRRDRVDKVREYALVPSIRRYVIVDTASRELTVLYRHANATDWSREILTSEDVLTLPEVGLRIPVAEIYEDSSVSL
jgi:Uma2 family endonuclease